MPKRTDSNQAEIMDALRKAGCLCHDTHELGHGYPDIMVGSKHGPWWKYQSLYLLEVKARGAKLTGDEPAWHALWDGYPVYIVHDVAEAFAAVGIETED